MTQSNGNPALFVDGPNPWTITTPTSFSGTTGYVTFTTTANPGYTVGSEFEVTGASPSGYNGAYVAVTGTSGTTIVGNHLSGPVGRPSALSNPGAWVSGGTLNSVLMPGMQVLGTVINKNISPYGTFNSTGTGSTLTAGTYALTGNQASYTFTGSITATTLTLTSTPAPLLAPGQSLTSSTGGGFSATHVVALLTGSGASGSTYSVDVSQTAAAGTITAAGTLFSSGTPGVIFAAPTFYQTIAPSATLPGAVTPIAQGSLGGISGDFINELGSLNNTVITTQDTTWPGAEANTGMLWGQFPLTTSGAPDTTQLANICKKTEDVQTFVQAQTAGGNTMSVQSLYRMNDVGIWGDSSDATITGYVTAGSFPSTSATLNVVSTTFGSLALSTGTQTAKLTGLGLPVATPVTIPLTTSSSATYAITGTVLAAIGSSGSPVTFEVGQFSPATPVLSNVVTGYIDQGGPGSSGLLHITGITPGATFTNAFPSTQFTATINNCSPTCATSTTAGNSLGVTLPVYGTGVNPALSIGSTISANVGTSIGTPTVTAQTATPSLNNGYQGTYTISGSAQLVASEIMQATGPLAGMADHLNYSSVSGTPVSRMVITDGNVNISPTSPIALLGSAGTNSFNTIPNYYQPTIGPETMYGSFMKANPGQYVLGNDATSKGELLAPVEITGIQTLAPAGCPTNGNPICGTYFLSNALNTVGSSGSPVSLLLTSATGGGSLDPGPALKIRDQGPGVMFVTSAQSCTSYGNCTGSGPVNLSGTFDTSVLGGMPSTSPRVG